VAADVADGKITEEAAREQYGVVVREDGRVDEAGTAELRDGL
jgi:N-methylhydantoinase B